MKPETEYKTLKYAVIIAILIIFAVLMCGCGGGKPQSSTTVRGGWQIQSTMHDDHLFVVYERGGLLHHPDCTCQHVAE